MEGRLAAPTPNNCVLMIEDERIICWSCRGAASKEFVCEMKEILRAYKPRIVILIEPRVSGEVADRIYKIFGKKQWIRSEARGSSSGVWAFLEEGRLEWKCWRRMGPSYTWR